MNWKWKYRLQTAGIIAMWIAVVFGVIWLIDG
jgi:hypothetical protein